MAWSSWLIRGRWGRGGGYILIDRSLALLLTFLAPPHLPDDAGHIVERPRQRRLDHLGRAAEALGGGDQRPERPLDRHIELERDAVNRTDQPLGAGVAQAHSLDRHPGRELAIQIAVEADDHRLEAQVAQRIEGEA